MTNKLNAASIYNAFVNGEALTDAEVECGYNFYTNLAKQLSECSVEFRLAHREALNTANALEQFRDARKYHKRWTLE